MKTPPPVLSRMRVVGRTPGDRITSSKSIAVEVGDVGPVAAVVDVCRQRRQDVAGGGAAPQLRSFARMVQQQVEPPVVVGVEELQALVEAQRQAERGPAIDEARDTADDALVEIEMAGRVEVDVAVPVDVDRLHAFRLGVFRPAAIGHAGGVGDVGEVSGAVVQQQEELLARIVVRVLDEEQIDVAVVVVVGGGDGVAEAADVERGEGRILDVGAVRPAQEQPGDAGRVADRHVGPGHEIEPPVAVEIGEPVLAVVGGGEAIDDRTEADRAQVLLDQLTADVPRARELDDGRRRRCRRSPETAASRARSTARSESPGRGARSPRSCR